MRSRKAGAERSGTAAFAVDGMADELGGGLALCLVLAAVAGMDGMGQDALIGEAVFQGGPGRPFPRGVPRRTPVLPECTSLPSPY